MNIFGLDIGSTSIKLVQAEKIKDKFRLLTAGIVPTPQPGLVSESEADLITLATALKKLHQDARVSSKKVVTALPEGEVFTRVVELPPMSEDELSQAIFWEAEQFVPKPLNEVILDWQIISRGEVDQQVRQMRIFLVAAPKLLVEKYLQVCQLAGFEVAGLETEIIAAARALVPPGSPPTMLVDFGAKTTDLAIVENGQVVLTRSIPTAGEAFTRAISTGLSLEIPQAEEYKRVYGLEGNKLEGKVKAALIPVFAVVASEIKKALAFWREKETQPVASLILAGGTANLPEISPFFTKELGIEVQIADPFFLFVESEKIISQLKSNASVFVIATGLALKGV